MVRLEYSQVVRRKLKKLRNELSQNYGEDNSKKIMRNITEGIRRLQIFPLSGTKISSEYEIECDYSYIFLEHNYFFYREKTKIQYLFWRWFTKRKTLCGSYLGL